MSMQNLHRRTTPDATGSRPGSGSRMAVVTSYNPATHNAKVQFLPGDQHSGWLPVLTPWVGNGWGLYCPPAPGDQVEVRFEDGCHSTGMVCLRAFSNQDRPLSVMPGEFWLVDKSGSFLKLTNDANGNGTLLINGQFALTATAPTVTVRGSQSIALSAPAITLGGTVEGLHKLVTDALVALFNSHSHPGPGAPPSQQMGAGHLTTAVSAG